MLSLFGSKGRLRRLHSGIQADMGSVISDPGFQDHSGQHSEANEEREVVGDQMMFSGARPGSGKSIFVHNWLVEFSHVAIFTSGESVGNKDQ